MKFKKPSKLRSNVISVRMKHSVALLLIATSLMLVGCKRQHDVAMAKQKSVSPATVDLKRNAFVVHNLYYSQQGPKSNSQTIDLYWPALTNNPPYPVIIWLHGGSWLYGDKNMDCLPCDHMLGKYAVASVNYRLATEAAYPAQIQDLKAAVRFLRAHAKTYKLDPNRIAVWGTSAGGHLAALLGTSGDVKQLEGDLGWKKYSSRVQAVCDWSGPTDFNTAQKQSPPTNKIRFDDQSSPVFGLMGGRMDKASLATASPITYVSKDDPPFLIMHGDIDDAIPAAQSQQLADSLKAQKVDVTFHLLKGVGHSFGTLEDFKTVEEFFDKKMISPKAAKGKR